MENSVSDYGTNLECLRNAFLFCKTLPNIPNVEFVLEVVSSDDCYADVGTYRLRISSGLIQAMANMKDSAPIFYSLRSAYSWLFLHELKHLELGHFLMLGKVPTFSLVSRGKHESYSIQNLPKRLCHKAKPCLELQADHDAIELMLESYSHDRWDKIRSNIASILAVMVLIEKTDEKNQVEHSTHPKAATRIFQLLGHVTEMWSLPAHAKAKSRGETTISEDDLPSDQEKQAFSKEVILPAFWDAVALAEVAQAKSIISDLGSPENFFADVARAKLGQWDELVTVGAIEWAELKDANDQILPLLPINQETT